MARTHPHTHAAVHHNHGCDPTSLCPPYERQIVWAISGGPERLQPGSEAMEEVAVHRQALLAASHTLLYPPQTPSLHLTCNIRGFNLPSEHHVSSSKFLLAFTHSVLNAHQLQLRCDKGDNPFFSTPTI